MKNPRRLVCFLLVLIQVGHRLTAEEAQVPAVESIQNSTAFYPRLLPVGTNAPPAEDSEQLALILKDIEAKTGFEGSEERLVEFLAARPHSPWSPALALAMAERFRDLGAYTKALNFWSSAWEATKDNDDLASRRVADASIAQRASLLASLGRRDDLLAIKQETQGRRIEPERIMEIYHRAMLAVDLMQHAPGGSYRCGSYALYNVALKLGLESQRGSFEELRNEDSPDGGFTLSQLVELAGKYQIPVGAVRWANSAAIPVPSVVHWKQNHYAAILEQNGNLYRVMDPTFGQPRWIRENVIRDEASGYFLIPQNRVSEPWIAVSAEEGASIRGKGQNGQTPNEDEEPPCDPDPNDPCPKPDEGCNGKATGDSDDEDGEDDPLNFDDDDPSSWADGGCTDCDSFDDLAMVRWQVTEPYISLWLRDTPMFYQTPRMGRFALRLAYHKPEGALDQPETPELATFGNHWNCNWLSYMNASSDNGFTNFMTIIRGPNGGGRRYSELNLTIPDPRSRTTISKTMSGTNLTAVTVHHISGAKTVYGYVQTLVAGTSYRVFMTQQIAPDGLTNATYRYTTSSGNILLTEVLDELGQTNKISYYTGTGQKTWVKEIENPFQRKVSFTYESGGYLTNIADVLGISSGIQYTSYTNGANVLRVPTSLVTPYGTTTFSYLDPFAPAYSQGGYPFQNGINRALLVTRPNGAKHLFMYRDQSDTVYVNGINQPLISTAEFPFPSAPCPPFYYWYMYYRNSFYWSPRHVELLGLANINGVTNLTVAKYQLARWRNWLHERPYNATLSTTINMERAASADGVSEGPYTWYSYEGKPDIDPMAGYPCNVDATLPGLWQIPALIARVDPGGKTNYLKREFDSRGHVTKTIKTITNPDGSIGTRINEFLYSTNGVDLVRHLNAKGHTNLWGYDSGHRVTSFTNVYGEITRYAYTSAGLLSGTANAASGLITTNIYGGNGYLSKTFSWEMIGGTPKYYGTNDYTFSSGNVATLTSPRGLTRTFSYDALNRLTNIAFPGNSISRVFGNTNRPLGLTQYRDRLGNSTYFTWDSNRKLTAITNALGNVRGFNWCSCGSLDSVTDAENKTTQFFYDLRGRRTGAILPGGAWITNVYDAIGRLSSLTNSFGFRLGFTLNQQGRPTLITSSLGNEWDVKYDAFDQATNVVDINGITTKATYDALGRLVSVIYPDTGVDSYAYSPRGPTNFTNPLGDPTWYAFDAWGG